MTATWAGLPVGVTAHAAVRWAARVGRPVRDLPASLAAATRARGKAVRRVTRFLGHGRRTPRQPGDFLLENVPDGVVFVLRRNPEGVVLVTVVTWAVVRAHEQAARRAREHKGAFGDEWYPVPWESR